MTVTRAATFNRIKASYSNNKKDTYLWRTCVHRTSTYSSLCINIRSYIKFVDQKIESAFYHEL